VAPTACNAVPALQHTSRGVTRRAREEEDLRSAGPSNLSTDARGCSPGASGATSVMRLWKSASVASTGGGQSADAFANGSGQNGRRASSQAVSAIDRPARASSGACLCAGGPAGAGAGAGVSDAIMRTQISHRRTFQHRPEVSQA